MNQHQFLNQVHATKLRGMLKCVHKDTINWLQFDASFLEIFNQKQSIVKQN